MKKLLFFLLSLIILVACGGKKEQEHTADRAVNTTTNDTITTTNNTTTNNTSITAPTIINDTTIRKYYHKDETEDCTRFMEFEYYMPQLNKVAEDSIWRTITCSLCKTYYDSLSCEKTSIGMETDFFEKINEDPNHYLYAIHYGRPVWVTKNFVAYTTWECHYKSQGEYSLHEYETVKHYLFDAKIGRRITVNEIFTTKGLSDMIDKVDQDLIVMLESALLFHPTEINNTQFTTDTITITYNPYAVSGYNQGIIQLKYPTNEILPYLNKKSVIYKAIAK